MVLAQIGAQTKQPNDHTGSVAVALNVNLPNMVANTYWTVNTAMDAHSKGTDFVDSLTGPWQNLSERFSNTLDGRGPRTNEEL